MSQLNSTWRFLVIVVAAILLLALGDSTAWAELRLANVFADHMVVQCDQPVRIWGWGEKEAEVTVTFASVSAMASVGANGTWSVSLQPLDATAEGKELRVHSGNYAEFDREMYRDRNIIERLIGWLKECLRVATRFEKTAKNFGGFVKMAFIERYLRLMGVS